MNREANDSSALCIWALGRVPNKPKMGVPWWRQLWGAWLGMNWILIMYAKFIMRLSLRVILPLLSRDLNLGGAENIKFPFSACFVLTKKLWTGHTVTAWAGGLWFLVKSDKKWIRDYLWLKREARNSHGSNALTWISYAPVTGDRKSRDQANRLLSFGAKFCFLAKIINSWVPPGAILRATTIPKISCSL